jgi:hypothetical protein
LSDLEAGFLEHYGAVSELKLGVAAKREEIAGLKGLKGRSSVKSSGMEMKIEPRPEGKQVKRRPGKLTPRISPVAEVVGLMPCNGDTSRAAQSGNFLRHTK